jgi:hypothetical protein
MPSEHNTITPGDFVLSGFPVQTRTITIVANAGALARGSVLGKITSGGKFKLSLAASDDGSELLAGARILAHDVPASASDQTAIVYDAGVFDGSRLTFGAGQAAAALETAMRDADAKVYIQLPK